jgi:site-specific recombinase XerD
MNSVKKAEEVRAAVKSGVVEMMNAGKLQPSSINVYLRAMNAFIRWGSLEEHFKPPIRSIQLLKTTTKVLPTLNETQVQHIVQFKPKWRKESRVPQDIMLRLGFTALCTVALVALITFAKWAFRKRTGDRNSKLTH